MKNDVSKFDLCTTNALPPNFFRIASLICNGSVIGDIENFNLAGEISHRLQPAEAKMNDAIDSLGLCDQQTGSLPPIGYDIKNVSPVVPANQPRVVTCSLPFGIFNQERKLPVSFLISAERVRTSKLFP